MPRPDINAILAAADAAPGPADGAELYLEITVCGDYDDCAVLDSERCPDNLEPDVILPHHVGLSFEICDFYITARTAVPDLCAYIVELERALGDIVKCWDGAQVPDMNVGLVHPALIEAARALLPAQAKEPGYNIYVDKGKCALPAQCAQAKGDK